jgi:predicted HTH transcriptional regulator
VTSEELRALLQRPEDESLEFKSNLPSREALVRNLASFANSGGGTLVLGFDERNRTPIGLAHPGVALDHVRQWAKGITPPPRIKAEAVELEPGRTIGVVRVEPSADIHVVDGLVLQRMGSRTMRMDEAALREAVSRAAPVNVANAMAAMEHQIGLLTAQLAWKKQLPYQVGFLVAGAVLGYLLAVWNPLG